VSIVAECPHCLTRLTLRPEAAGRKMRCPNPDCRQVFVVEERKPRRPQPAARPAPPPDPALPHIPPDPSDIPEAEVVEAEPVEAVEAEVVPPPAKEVVWSPDADLPGGPPPPPRRPGTGSKPAAAVRAAVEEYPEEDDEPVVRRRRKKKRNLAPVFLIGGIAATVVAAGVGIYFVVTREKNTEEKDAAEAKGLYEKAEFGAAAKKYGELAAKHAAGQKGGEYKFFADLSEVRKAVGSVTNRENPKAAFDAFTAFAAAAEKNPLAKPDQYGHDVFESGRKLGEDMAGYAQDRVEAFVKDRAKMEELRKADEMIEAGRKLLPLLERFRPRDAAPADALEKEFTGAAAAVGRERHRLRVIEQVRSILADPTDPAIAEAKLVLATNGLADDAEARSLVQAAEGAFLKRVRYEPNPAPGLPPAAAGSPSLLFAAPVGRVPEKAAGPADGPPGGVFLAVARGVLYALDEEAGDLLWAVRVGPGVYDPPTVARVNTAAGPADVAVVAGEVAGQPTVAGYAARTGQPQWQQRLPAAAAGPAAVIGGRAFVPLRDAAGSVYVLDLVTGNRLGWIVLGQPVGPVVARPGTNLLYVAGESRRIFVFDVEASDADGTRPRCVRVLPTDHPAGTLKSAPIFLGPPGDDPGEQRWLLLSQADGPTAMRLRAYPLAPAPQLPPGADPVTDPVAPQADVPVPGWSWFPPVSDGERLAAVTDAGQLRLFGVNQRGSHDAPVFPLPTPALARPADALPVPGLVVPAEDGAFWVLVNGSLQKFRLSLLADKGLVVVPGGPAVPLGVPTQPAQLSPRRDAVCFVVRTATGSGARAVLIRLGDGGPRWQRQLGLVSAAAPVRTGGGLLLVGEDGAAAAVPAAGLAIPPGVTKAAPEWVAAGPPDGATGRTAVAASADGKTVFAVTPAASADGKPTFAVRRLEDGKLGHEGTVSAPGGLAGPPAVLNGRLLLPVSDGFVYRHEPGDGRLRPDALTQGPRWRGERRFPDPVAWVVPVGGDAFVTTDGGRGMARWLWAAGGSYEDGGGRWEVRERIAAAPAVLPGAEGRPARLLVADVTGGVWLFPADRPGDPLRRWLPGRTANLPGGRPGGFAVQADPSGKPTAVYAADGRQVVCLDPDADAPVWVTAASDDAGAVVVGAPLPAGDGRWLVTELGGRVRLVDGATGRDVEAKAVGLPGAVPAAAGVPAGGGRVLVPLSDGSAAVVELTPSAGEPKGKE
jgi:outer membrane protein assembly factor BamB